MCVYIYYSTYLDYIHLTLSNSLELPPHFPPSFVFLNFYNPVSSFSKACMCMDAGPSKEHRSMDSLPEVTSLKNLTLLQETIDSQ